jgi:hypothetical protein
LKTVDVSSGTSILDLNNSEIFNNVASHANLMPMNEMSISQNSKIACSLQTSGAMGQALKEFEQMT